MHLLVTRPEPDGLKLKGLLEELGHEATVEPLLAVSFDNAEPIDLDGIQALIATSRNGLRALLQSPTHAAARRVPLFAVGTATAREAQRMGFERIIVGPGRVDGLVPLIAGALDPADGFVLHLAGERLSGALAADLSDLGFRVHQPVVYRMRPAEAFSAATVDRIGEGDIDGAILMSPQTASIYARLVIRHRLGLACRRLLHICLSGAVAARLEPLGPVPRAIAAEPTLEEVLALVQASVAKLQR